MSTKPRAAQYLEFEEAAQEYLRSLPPEHFMEATPQATQRKITLESLDLVHAQCPQVKVYNELLVQYYHGKPPVIRRVVPDNMVVLHDAEIRAVSSFNLPLQPVGPFWMLEYVSKESNRKDYEESFDKYEKELKVPYYLVFYPDNQELTLYRHNKRRYVTVKPNEHDRYAIPELELEMAILDGWVRYWFRGELLPLPAELLRDLENTRRLLEQERRRRVALEEEVARLRAQLGLGREAQS